MFCARLDTRQRLERAWSVDGTSTSARQFDLEFDSCRQVLDRCQLPAGLNYKVGRSGAAHAACGHQRAASRHSDRVHRDSRHTAHQSEAAEGSAFRAGRGPGRSGSWPHHGSVRRPPARARLHPLLRVDRLYPRVGCYESGAIPRGISAFSFQAETDRLRVGERTRVTKSSRIVNRIRYTAKSNETTPAVSR